jgi:hypothetical protein
MSITHKFTFDHEGHSEFTLHGVASGSFPEEHTQLNLFTPLPKETFTYALYCADGAGSRTLVRIKVRLFEKEVGTLIRGLQSKRHRASAP